MAEPTTVVKTDTATSWKTTVLGVLTGIGLIIDELTRAGFPDDAAGWIALVLKGFGPMLLGWFTRDRNVSSEGHKVVTPTAKG